LIVERILSPRLGISSLRLDGRPAVEALFLLASDLQKQVIQLMEGRKNESAQAKTT
jgi:hypothetical protein